MVKVAAPQPLPPKWLEIWLKRALWFLPTRKFRANTKRATDLAERLLPVLEDQWRRSGEIGLKSYGPLYNGMCFVLLLYYDFAVCAFQQGTEVDRDKQNLFSRQLCSLLHEAVDDIPQVLGKSFRKELQRLPNGAAHETNLDHQLKYLSTFRKAHQDDLYKIRNFVAAHRDHNALLQIELMRAIDQNHIVSLSGQFVEFMGKLAQALTPIMEEMGKPSVMLRILGVTRERGEPTN